ncbi:hypothetical protein BH23BAC1_BH23BAC1_23330 [soil metagenome]
MFFYAHRYYLLSYLPGTTSFCFPMEINSSFAGEGGAPRLSSNFLLYTFRHTDRKEFNYDIRTSYDQFIPQIRSGVGITAHTSSWESNFSSRLGIGIAIAPKFSVKGKYTFSPSLDFHYSSVNPYNTAWPFLSEKHGRIQSNFGLLLNTKKYYIGYSVSLMNRIFFNNDQPSLARDEFRSNIHGGYTFQRSPNSNFSFTAQLAFLIVHNREFQESWVFIPFNFTFRQKILIWGISNAGLHLGLQNARLRLMISNNLGIPNENHISNLSFRYLLPGRSYSSSGFRSEL